MSDRQHGFRPHRSTSTAILQLMDSIFLDAKDGKVAVSGWVEVTEFSDEEFANQWKQHGINRVIYTDISRDGMLTGPNLSSLRRMAIATGLKITASGGVSSLDDLKQLVELERDGVDEVIVGKAIYEGHITLDELVTFGASC